MDPVFELPISLPPRGSRERLRCLHQQLRTAIVEGRLKPGLRLPPTRELASAYNVSRNTVVAAYELLISEGYLTTRRGSGTFVADTLPRIRHRPPVTTDPAAEKRLSAFWRNPPPLWPSSTRDSFRFDFRVGTPDIQRFPFDVWRRLYARALRALSKAHPAAPEDPQGRYTLREAIAMHTAFARAVACQADDIVVTSGAQQAFDLLARILVTPGRTIVAVESPGYPPARAAFAAAGARIVPVPVDEQGLVVSRIPPRARVICVTPSHQFPLGSAMSMERRVALLEHTQAKGAVVIEDDYDGEFRFGGRPLDALQTLDRTGSVFYVGTFSKSLFPALRLGFVVSPPWARRALVTAKQHADVQCGIVSQEALAAFIREGHLARHIRRMRQIYGARRETLLQGLHEDFAERLQVIPSLAGLHVSAWPQSSCAVDTVVARAQSQGIGLQSMRHCYVGRAGRALLAFGYGLIGERDIREGLSALRKLFG